MRDYQRSKVPAPRERMRPPADNKFIHPFVRWIWTEMNYQRASQEDIAARSGVSSSAMRKWHQGINSPKLMDIEAVVNALGYDLAIKPRRDDDALA